MRIGVEIGNETKVHRFNYCQIALILTMGMTVFIVTHHLSQSHLAVFQPLAQPHNESKALQLAKEVEEILTEQEMLIAEETENYNFPKGKYGIKAKSLDDLLMYKGGQPIRNMIVTSWRSGSTFLGDVLDSHPANYYHYEPLLHFDIVQVRGGEMAQNALDVLRKLLLCNYTNMEDYLSYGETHPWLFLHNSRLWEQCTKHPNACWKPDLLNRFCQLFPFQSMKTVRLRLELAKHLLDDPRLNIRVLYMVRDPRGTMQSRKHRDWCPGNPDCDNPRLLCEDLVADYKSAKWMYKKYKGRLRVLRYEDLSVSPYDGVKDLFKFFGLDFHPNVVAYLDTHTKFNSGGVSSTFRDSRTAPFHWRSDLSFTEVSVVQSLCKEAMDLWGYEMAYNQTHQLNLEPLADFKWP